MWRKLFVSGETPKSWIVEDGEIERAVPKRKPRSRIWAFSEREVALGVFRDFEMPSVLELLRECEDNETFLTIAKMLGSKIPDALNGTSLTISD